MNISRYSPKESGADLRLAADRKQTRRAKRTGPLLWVKNESHRGVVEALLLLGWTSQSCTRGLRRNILAEHRLMTDGIDRLKRGMGDRHLRTVPAGHGTNERIVLGVPRLKAKRVGVGNPRSKKMSVVANLGELEAPVIILLSIVVETRVVLRVRVDKSKARVRAEVLERESVVGGSETGFVSSSILKTLSGDNIPRSSRRPVRDGPIRGNVYFS